MVINVTGVPRGKGFDYAPPRILFGGNETERRQHYKNQFELLIEHWDQIPWRQWGVGSAREIGDLLREIGSGETVLASINNQLIRNVEIVIVFVFTKDGKWLVEEPQHMADGRVRNRRFPYISETLRQGESSYDTAVRAVREESGGHIVIGKDRLVSGEIHNLTENHAYNTGSTSYPGLKSVKKAYTFGLVITETEYRAKYTEVDVSGSVTIHTWKPVSEHIFFNHTILEEKIGETVSFPINT
jgi:hypothetical protein